MNIKSMKWYYFLGCIGLSAYAGGSLAPTDKVTEGLTTAIASLKMDKVAVPNVMPAPTTHARYFVSAERKSNGSGYIVSFDNTANCHGAQYCSVGSISTELQGNPTVYFDNQNHEITQRVVLPKGGVVYYTPSHAMGSFWPGRIEWRCDITLYTLSWELPSANERADLLQMVSSMWDKVC
ncbi:MAG: hypothetical protein K0R48_600 [Gammaproteobacteria bacterium]|jgi:hypothetical protein|nr:hypothetical protein [Gammaproteobacteria bacterium]